MDNKTLIIFVLVLLFLCAVSAIFIIMAIVRGMRKEYDNTLGIILDILKHGEVEMTITPVSTQKGEKLYCRDFFITLRRYEDRSKLFYSRKFRVSVNDFNSIVELELWVIGMIKEQISLLNKGQDGKDKEVLE